MGKKNKVHVKRNIMKKKLSKKSKNTNIGNIVDFLSEDFQKNGESESESSNQPDSEASDMENLEAELENNDVSDGNEDTVGSGSDTDDEELSLSKAEEFEKEHMASLAKLKQTDPEFYKFLEENDKKLLKFNLSDDKEGSSDEEPQKLHAPDSADLEVASDESDFEDDKEESEGKNVITLKLLKKWQNDVATDKSNKTLNNLSQAFHAALLRVSPDDNTTMPKFKVEGSAVFNGVIQLCVLEFGPAVKRFLGLGSGSKQQPHKCKKFVKVKNILKSYFDDLINLLSGVTSANIQTILLKHLHYMSSMLVSFPHTAKSVLKQLVKMWSGADEGVRVISFFCILRITRNDQATLLDSALKSMYMSYVKNSKFVSISTLAGINFMRRSLVEMFALDLNFAYQHVFVYIRQLAIHLRNAITVQKKENTQAVYNWQYVNSLKLWGSLLGLVGDHHQMKQLVYPFVQVCLGTIRLVPTTQYYPLRFHLTQVLMELSRDTGVFIPILPFIVDVLNNYDFNKKHQKVSMKPMDFTFSLRLSKSQLVENGFKDTLIDTVYSQLLEYMNQQSHSIAFPELTVTCRIQIKQFMKKCKNANYVRKIKQALEKIEQNAQFIEKERQKFTVNLADFKLIKGWESQIRNKGTPMSIYYNSWIEIRNQKKRKDITNNEELGNYKLPALKRPANSGVSRTKVKEGPVELFPSDSEEDDEEIGSKTKKRRGKRGKKHVKDQDYSQIVDDGGKEDIVEDIDISDW